MTIFEALKLLKAWNVFVSTFKKEVSMTGWKTWAGGIGIILVGAGTVVQGLTDGDLEKVKAGAMMIASGLGLIGIGHKIEKSTNGGQK